MSEEKSGKPHRRLPGHAGQRLHGLLWRDCSAPITYAVAAAIAAMLLASIFPLPFLLGKGAWFQQGDAAQNLSGWLAFVQDRWHFPLLKTELINAPEGISIAFTDSIPLAALLFKPLAPWLPEGFHYFGYWFVLAYLLQALGANFVIRSLGVRGLAGTLAAVSFALIWPAFTARAGHVALSTHGALLFALGLYLRSHADAIGPMRANAWLLVLGVLSLLVHPYLFAMTQGFFVAALVDQALRRRAPWATQLAWLAASILAGGVLMYVGGYLGPNLRIGGFGTNSLNLLSPFCGGFLCRVPDATGGQAFEGFAYFGAGFLAILAIAVAVAWRAGRFRGLRSDPVLLALVLLFTLYALSNKAYLGGVLVYDLPLPGFATAVTDTFRASARFFWPVGYACLFVALAVLLRLRNAYVLGVIALALLVQWVDTQPLRDEVGKRASVRQASSEGALGRIAGNARGLHLYPSFGCGTPPPNAYLPYQMFAARHGIPINTAYTARTSAHCAGDRDRFDGVVQPGQLYVYLASPSTGGPFATVPEVFAQASRQSDCTTLGGDVLCMAGLPGGAAAQLPVMPRAQAHSWKASELPTMVGSREQGRLVAAASGKDGFLSYGPYFDLPRGRYRLAVVYSSAAATTTKVGRLEFGNYLHGEHNLLLLDLYGTQGQWTTTHAEVVLDRYVDQAEMRVHAFGTGEIRLEAIGVRRLQAAPAQ